MANTPIRQVINEIVSINRSIAEFWSRAHGWAPGNCADLLSVSRLDRQASLSACLRIWLRNTDGLQDDGRLVLAWANLGALVEGSMKFALCVFGDDYARTPVLGRKHAVVEPDVLMLESLRQFFNKYFWTDNQQKRWGPFVELVQQRRNGIHAYKDRDIGTRKEFCNAVRMYHSFLRDINGRVPYP